MVHNVFDIDEPDNFQVETFFGLNDVKVKDVISCRETKMAICYLWESFLRVYISIYIDKVTYISVLGFSKNANHMRPLVAILYQWRWPPPSLDSKRWVIDEN